MRGAISIAWTFCEAPVRPQDCPNMGPIWPRDDPLWGWGVWDSGGGGSWSGDGDPWGGGFREWGVQDAGIRGWGVLESGWGTLDIEEGIQGIGGHGMGMWGHGAGDGESWGGKFCRVEIPG